MQRTDSSTRKTPSDVKRIPPGDYRLDGRSLWDLAHEKQVVFLRSMHWHTEDRCFPVVSIEGPSLIEIAGRAFGPFHRLVLVDQGLFATDASAFIARFDEGREEWIADDDQAGHASVAIREAA